MNRRQLLRLAGLASAVTLIPVARDAWALRSEGDAAAPERLIVVFLRGAVDGLSVVVPREEPAYYDHRPTVAIDGSGGAAPLELDGRFGLHPALKSMMPLWRERSLAFVHACGSPDPTRSHFDAQDYMESGTPGVKSTPDGWMNRLLAELPAARDVTRAVSFGPRLPLSFKGREVVANVPVGKAAARPMPLDRPRVSNAFDRLYDGRDALSVAYQTGLASRRQLLPALVADMEAADNGAPPVSQLTVMTQQGARLLARDASIRLVFFGVGDWDTHVNQGGAQGQLANRLGRLGDALAALAHDLGPVYERTVVVVMSEFGRTVHENGDGGTDHGHGNVMWVFGGPVRGGKVYARWPGLADEQLYQGRDLAVTTDFRDVLREVLRAHLGLDRAQLGRVFPGYASTSASLHGLIA